MADVVAAQGLVQVMRELLAHPDGDERGWLGTRLEVSRRLRTDPEFQERWRAHSAALAAATRARLERQAAAGAVRDDVPVPVLARYLDLVLEGLVSHLAQGLPVDELDAVLDLVEGAVRREEPRRTRRALDRGRPADREVEQLQRGRQHVVHRDVAQHAGVVPAGFVE